MTAKVARGDLDVSISGSGTVQPFAKFDIVPLVKGNILSAPFEEGMKVKAGDLLYKIDDSDLSNNIQKTQNSIDKLNVSNQSTQDSIKNLEVFAPCDGKLTDFSIKAGEQVGGNNGKLADIVNDKKIVINASFSASQLKEIKVGQKVLAIGNPFGFNGTLTLGIISRIDNERNKIQTDAAINPGSSGGPLLNTNGEVIGINQSIYNPDNNKSNIGIGFAVPVNVARKFIASFRTNSKYQVTTNMKSFPQNN
jgi:multidrug resistance efflux pump